MLLVQLLHMIKLNADSLRKTKVSEEERKIIQKNPIYIVLDNVLDTYNIGAIFRLADAVSAEEVLLCRGSETPPNSRIKKASINTTEWVNWKYFEKTIDAISYLRQKDDRIQIVAIEQNKKSVLYNKVEYQFPVALVVGHETDGISQEVLDMVDTIVELPMYGVNISLNVMVSLGIVMYEVVRHVKTHNGNSI